MSPDLQIGLSFALTFGVPALLAVRELLLLRRDDGPPDWIWRPEDMRPPDPRPMPAPVKVQTRVRELEDA
jgi:predicted glycoside hydrolase/deacetylase ChbG (UPF0249 family)